MVPVALGTQTAGSVIRPAAYCGVYGYKPARGWISTKGVWLLTEHFDTIGLFSRSAADLALLYGALRTAAPLESPFWSQRRPGSGPRRVAVLSGEEWATSDEDVRDALAHVAGRLVRQGLGSLRDGDAGHLAAAPRAPRHGYGRRGGEEPPCRARAEGRADLR